MWPSANLYGDHTQMHSLIGRCGRCHKQYVRGLSYAGDLLLLVVRLYWGWHLAVSGWYKFVNLDQTTAYFHNLGIVWPRLSAVASGSVELVCGSLLVIGLASRIAAVPLVINMLVAYVANSPGAIRHLFVNPNEFVTSPEFLFLFACLLVLVFGPGMISADGLLGTLFGGLAAEERSARDALHDPVGGAAEPVNRHRREFAKLTAAAFAGLMAGILVDLARDHSNSAGTAASTGGSFPQSPKPNTEIVQANTAESNPPKPSSPTIPPPPKGTDVNLLMVGDPHVCRGLNICRGKDKKHNNSCAGRGACATAESHACNGQNVCKGQAGCDSTAGINTCKGKGACAVPLKDATWKIARARFEQLAKAKHLAIGPAPAKS